MTSERKIKKWNEFLTGILVRLVLPANVILVVRKPIKVGEAYGIVRNGRKFVPTTNRTAIFIG